MKEGRWYKVIDSTNAIDYPRGSEVKLRVGDFWVLAGDDGSDTPWFRSVSGAGTWFKKHRFDPTPYIRKADGRFAPEKENTMIEGKFYRCIQADGGHTRVGDFCQLVDDDGSECPNFRLPNGKTRWLYRTDFDPTPYDAPHGEENTMIEGKWYKCITSGSGVEAGKYYRCADGNESDVLVDMEGVIGNVYRRRFDPTPHDRTVFPNAPDLLERVRCIDPAAAEWLEFGDHSKVDSFDASQCSLDDMMIWSSTPHGHNYWKRIHDAVDYEEEETPVTETFKKGERVEVRDDEDDDWGPAVFLCMDEESEFNYVARRDCDETAVAFNYCRRPMTAPTRPHIEPGTPIEVWDDEGEKPRLERFGGYHDDYGVLFTDADGCFWKHCRVLVPNGVEV